MKLIQKQREHHELASEGIFIMLNVARDAILTNASKHKQSISEIKSWSSVVASSPGEVNPDEVDISKKHSENFICSLENMNMEIHPRV